MIPISWRRRDGLAPRPGGRTRRAACARGRARARERAPARPVVKPLLVASLTVLAVFVGAGLAYLLGGLASLWAKAFRGGWRVWR
jgi:hypothetical protein